MKKFLLMFLPLFLGITMYAQEEGELEDGKWVLKGVTGLNFAQTAVVNWSAGGENTVAGNFYLNGTLNRKSGNWLWSNTLALEYGVANAKSLGTRKSGDKIDFTSQLGYSSDNKWFYTLMGDFKTQFYKGYDYSTEPRSYISNFFSPAYTNLSAGLEYRPGKWYTLYLSPVAGKLTFVNSDFLSSQGAFGVDLGKHFKAELGAFFKARAEKNIMENVSFISTVDLFTAYNSTFGNVDVNWDLLISMKINKFLSATINTTLKYDDDISSMADDGTPQGPRVQFKEVLGIGLAYNF